MTEREYEGVLDAVQNAINPSEKDFVRMGPTAVPAAANDNSVEWPLAPFPEGWHASP